MKDKEQPFEITKDIRHFFEGTIEKFLCQDVEFIPASIDMKWLNKRRFDVNEMINEYKGGEPLKEHKILLPHFEDELLPISGGKYIRGDVLYYAGNVLKYLIETGELEKVPHNPQHVKYNSQKNNRKYITMNYQPDKGRWGYINKEEWDVLKQDVERAKTDERLFQAERHLMNVLKTGRNHIRSFQKEQTKKELELFLHLLEKEEYLLFTMPLLWNVFKAIPSNHESVIEKQTNCLYDQWNDIRDILNQHRQNERVDFSSSPKAKTFIEAAQRVFMKGYYVSDADGSKTAFPNIPLIYTICEQPKNYVKPNYVKIWENKAIEIALKENLKQFLPFKDVIKELNPKK